MSSSTSIEWTDATWQIITGCSIESSGCKNCYAMKLAGGRLRHHPSRIGLTQRSAAGPVWTGDVRFNHKWLDQPTCWARGRKIFVCAHSDLFHEAVPFEWIDKVFSVMLLTPQHTYQVLTKRAERMRSYIAELGTGKRTLLTTVEQVRRSMAASDKTVDSLGGERRVVVMPEHIWLGVSAENQETADARITHLLRTPAAKRWVSCEPLLSRIDLRALLAGYCPEHDVSSGLCADLHHAGVQRIDWVVVGGESGPGARVMHPAWPREIRDACKEARVAFFFKQWGGWFPEAVVAGGNLGDDMRRDLVRLVKPAGENDGHFREGDALMRRTTKKAAGRLLDGQLHETYPT